MTLAHRSRSCPNDNRRAAVEQLAFRVRVGIGGLSDRLRLARRQLATPGRRRGRGQASQLATGFDHASHGP